MAFQPEDHKDILGREVKEGDYVAFSHHNSLYVGTVEKVTPKQVRVNPITTKYKQESGYLKYTNQCCLVAGPDVTFHILKNT